MHGVSRRLLEQQAAALNIPLDLVHIPKAASNSVYLTRLNTVLHRLQSRGINKLAFGDLYLDDLRDFREENLDSIGMEALFPLWHRCTKELSHAFLNAKFKAVIVCVDEQTLDSSFVGRMYDRTLLADLPLTVDPCGENGEFHTFVFDGPLFAQPVTVKLGSRRSCDHFHYCDLTGRSKLSKISKSS
jgi:uncharacterized protein (TIGR00290 family)